MLQDILNYAHQLLKDTVKQGDLVIDATCGNGNDTLLLGHLAGEDGKVLAFDVQEQAIDATNKRIEKRGLSNVETVHKGHEFISDYVEEEQEIAAAIFNLGYLPKSDKTIITRADSTLHALDQMLPRLKQHGLIILVVYHGHPGGTEEKNAVLHYTAALNQNEYHVLQYGFINQKNNPPFIIAIEKR